MAKKKKAATQKETLFKESLVPAKPGSERLFEVSYDDSQPVECLGNKFESEDARRDYFLEKLREKLADPEFRKADGFPQGEVEDILAMSDPPYYTACPNPWIKDFVSSWKHQNSENEDYHRKPYAVDVSQGKSDAVYRAHSYHTKVPHLAIVPSILHYTNPGDLVLDGFSGSGMTGIAVRWCDVADKAYKQSINDQWKLEGRQRPRWGRRNVLLFDLSPSATFITANYNLPLQIDRFEKTANGILKQIKDELG